MGPAWCCARGILQAPVLVVEAKCLVPSTWSWRVSERGGTRMISAVPSFRLDIVLYTAEPKDDVNPHPPLAHEM